MKADLLPELGCPLPAWPQIESWWHKATGPEYGCLPQHIELAHAAARWGAEEQLRQCCQWVDEQQGIGAELQAYCRPPQPRPSLKQALGALERLVRRNCDVVQEAEDIALLHNMLERVCDE